MDKIGGTLGRTMQFIIRYWAIRVSGVGRIVQGLRYVGSGAGYALFHTRFRVAAPRGSVGVLMGFD